MTNCTKFTRALFLALLCAALLLPAMALAKTTLKKGEACPPAVKGSVKAQDATANMGKQERKAYKRLENYAQKKILSASQQLQICEDRKALKKVSGEWIATYYQYDLDSLKLKTKPAGKGKFVGLIKYARLTYESRGKSKKAALGGDFKLVKRRWMTEIARYEKGRWK